MGSGSWSTQSFCNYATSRGLKTDNSGNITTCALHDLYSSSHMDPKLDPSKTRECRDSEEHPNSIPVILALDVTGSMGEGAAKVAQKLNSIMTTLYDTVEDVEIMVMGIGDMECDYTPVQASQFESDIRIAEQLSLIYFEGHGGGNGYETYTSAWYMGARKCDCDCWERGKRGIIITMGDEPLNSSLNSDNIRETFGDAGQDMDTKALYKEASQKWDIYHIVVNDPSTSAKHYMTQIGNSWGEVLDSNHLLICDIEGISETIVKIIQGAQDSSMAALNLEPAQDNSFTEISW